MASRTSHAAKLAAPHHAYSPVLVRLADGTYDTFPAGHPLPAGAVKIARKEKSGWKEARNG